MTGRPPLWTPEEAREDFERNGKPDEPPDTLLRGCIADLPWSVGGCAVEGCLSTAVSCLLLLAVGMLLLR